MNPNALIATIQINLMRRPLLKLETVCDCLDKTRDQVSAMIDNGELPFAFDLATVFSKRRVHRNNQERNWTRQIRVFSLCVAERTGWTNPAGQTKNFSLPEVIGMILPARDVRSTDLKNRFNCSSDHIYNLAPNFTIIRRPAVKDGPESYTVFKRDSVAAFLEKRRML